MNRPLRHIAVFCGLLVLALLIRANWIQYAQSEPLAKHEKNRRVSIERYAKERGNIIVAGKPITGSKAVEGADFKYKRTFKDGAMYAPVTGYASQAFGANQLEALNDELLSGTDDRLFLKNTLNMFTNDEPRGGDVVTTIDPAAQKAAYEGLGDLKGGVAAIDPDTGRVLALASTPSYDPSTFAGMSEKDSKAWQKLNKDKNKPLLNRALKETYAPGSTFKVLTAAAAIESGRVSDINAPTDTPEPWTLPDTRTELPNLNKSGVCKNASLKVAMQYSCNTVFAKLAAEIGKDEMREIAEKFGFNNGELDIPVRAGKSVYPTDINRPQTALTGIGQGSLTASPLQIAMIASAIANDGKLMEPHMIDELRGPDTDILEKTDPKEMAQPISAETADKVREAMVFTAEQGSGQPALIDGIEVGAKTGTAQHGVDNKLPPYAWFISYGKNAEGKKVAVAVFVDPGQDIPRDQIAGGKLGGPIAKAVMEAVLKKG
ncbi:penicillin-binding transpeptidase domain-containing protein [Streptomyces sp. LHD-70]|uniref:peptidoglycan D,D-transpeptidase FtsI family protein n=1 Tax=Streptomyces sp. LHD-70 TaxID=3072140 RepID=UPI00280E8A25|nr:penicillin-binding transpeptidase domain-containing protein [Streptomyces sp. LHD-70]MDQ8704142.1 penicillin-binding transpeptidase domain-containing protein [Streptomyces sp. LHD-70]